MEATSTLATVEDLPGEAETAARRGKSREPLPDELLRVLESANGKDELLHRLALCVKRCATLAAVLYYDCSQSQRLADSLQRLDDEAELDHPTLRAVGDVCVQACKRGTAQLRSTSDGVPTPIVAVPVTTGQGTVEALCALLGPNTSQSPQRIAEILQLATAQIAVWQSRQTAGRAEQEARSSAALLELVGQIERSEDLPGGCLALVNGLQSFLGCQRVAVGVSRSSSRHCQLQALSGFARFDKQAEVATAVEAALDETLLLNEIICWPPAEDGQRLPARTHEELLATLGADSVLSVPLYDAQGEAVGACLLLNPREEDIKTITEFLRASQQQLGICLRWLQRSRGGPLSRAWRKLRGRFPRRRFSVAFLGVVILATFLASPRPHKIACDCQLQPIVRRFVAAPYDGTLQETLVRPGDVVAAGDVLAQMDGRETRLELSALDAEYARARKAWEVSLSMDDIHEAQQAKLEMNRLELKMQLLRQQQQDLQIKSPLRGFVISGDLENSEGAPLSVGQSLFEIAPTERMKVELLIPEEEIAYVQPGMEMRIRLDAYPRQLLSARITHIVPRAEVREDEFVFVAEAELDNAEETLRPGMNGRATLVGSRRPMA
ncbi:MAG: efflux RND transporter periplasmic adaptor subunit [Pirellulales bacterium]